MGHRERIVFQAPDGSIAIVNPVEPIQVPESVEAWLDRVAARAVNASIPRRDPEKETQAEYRARIDRLKASGEILAGYARVAVRDVDEFPKSRRFRDLWRHIGGHVYTDEVLAREKLLAELRDARDAALLASDHEKTKLDEIGTEKELAALADYRQSLRDLPAVVEAELAGYSLDQLERYQPLLPTP